MFDIVVTISEYYLGLLLIVGLGYCAYKIHRCDFFCTKPEERVERVLLKHNLTKDSPRWGRGKRVNKAIVDLDILINKAKHPYAKRVYRKARLGLLIDKGE